MLFILFRTLFSALRSGQAFARDNLPLRHTLDVLQRNAKRSHLIRQMSQINPLWGAPRIHEELLKLGIEIGQAMVSRYMVRLREPRSQGWRTFLMNHAQDIVSVDFFTVPTATLRGLYVFLALSNARRRIVHFNTSDSPTSHWIGWQTVEAFPWDTVPTYMIRDRDQRYRDEFPRRVESLGIKQVLISSRSP